MKNLHTIRQLKQLPSQKKPILSKKQLSTLPSTDKAINDGYDARIYFHIFGFAGDWYIAGYDPSTNIAYGYVAFAGMEDCAEAGYIDMDDFKEIQKLPYLAGGMLEVDKGYFEPTIGEAKSHYKKAVV